MNADSTSSAGGATRLTCPNCGTENEAGRNFCSSCGEPLASAAPTEEIDRPESGGGWKPPRWLKRAVVLVVVAALLVVIVNALLALRDDGGSALTTRANDRPTAATEPSDAATAGDDGGGTAAEPQRLPADVISAEASSVLPPVPDEGLSYGPDNTLDGDLATAWNDGAPGSGVGERLTFAFDEPVELVSLEIVNGYAKSADLYAANARVREARIVTDEVTTDVELLDIISPQTIDGPFGTTGSVTIEVLSVYPGNRYEDLAISEIVFWVRPGAEQGG